MLTPQLEAALLLMRAVSALRRTTSQRRRGADVIVVGSGKTPTTPGIRAKMGSADGPQPIPLRVSAQASSDTGLAATARIPQKSVRASGEAPQAVKADLALGTSFAPGDDARPKTLPPD